MTPPKPLTTRPPGAARRSPPEPALAIIAALISLAGCSRPEPPTMPPMEVAVVELVAEDIPIYLDMIGQTLGSVDIPIRARVDGVLEEIHFLEGRRVEKGQLLYVIDPLPYQTSVVEAEGRVAEARTRLAKAQSDLERIRPLAEMDAVSQQDLDSAVAQFEAAQGALQAAEAQLKHRGPGRRVRRPRTESGGPQRAVANRPDSGAFLD